MVCADSLLWLLPWLSAIHHFHQSGSELFSFCETPLQFAGIDKRTFVQPSAGIQDWAHGVFRSPRSSGSATRPGGGAVVGVLSSLIVESDVAWCT